MSTLIEMKDICKWYTTGTQTVKALDHVSLTVREGEMLAILGRSGSGKSTLMNMLGCLDTPTRGQYYLAGQSVSSMTGGQLSAVRGRTVGFVFQSFHLLAELTALENVALPLLYRGVPEKIRRKRAAACLEQVGLGDRLSHYPSQLSGGQQQRVAIARAMVGEPPVLLADEPTGNLDTAAGQEIMSLLRQWHQNGNTVILITHDPDIGAGCPRRVYITDGHLTE